MVSGETGRGRFWNKLGFREDKVWVGMAGDEFSRRKAVEEPGTGRPGARGSSSHSSRAAGAK